MINKGTKPNVRLSPPHHLGVASTAPSNNVVISNTNVNGITTSISNNMAHFQIARGNLSIRLKNGPLCDGELFFDTATNRLCIGMNGKVLAVNTTEISEISDERAMDEANTLKVIGKYFG